MRCAYAPTAFRSSESVLSARHVITHDYHTNHRALTDIIGRQAHARRQLRGWVRLLDKKQQLEAQETQTSDTDMELRKCTETLDSYVQQAAGKYTT